MRRILITNPVSRRLRRSQRGQSIVLLAFAFVALVAFVGLVTDVAMLFVRYAALRRAVDAAAIAAAGQIREGTDYGEVAIAAEQYIELHNLDSQSILVETCETDIHQWRLGLGPWEGDPHPESLYPKVNENMPETELCDWDDPHKFVRVSAQIESPTAFLLVLGIEALTLEATSVSETAVLDVALVIDTSESMSNETQIAHFTGTAGNGSGNTLPEGSEPVGVRDECYTDGLSLEENNRLLQWGACCNEPGQGLVSDGTVPKAGGGTLFNGYIWHDANGNGIWDNFLEDGVANNDTSGNYNALVCRPFKDVRDASRLFIKQLDFVRGDRVVLVTFDRNGVAYDPDDSGPLRPMIRSEQVATVTLDSQIGIWVNPSNRKNTCLALENAKIDWSNWEAGGRIGPAPVIRPYAYESLAPCGNTNIGGGLLAANNALTDPRDIRREAVWVIILLTDGAANVTNPAPDTASPNYGFAGFCPWWTFCFLDPTDADVDQPWPQCTSNNPTQVEIGAPFCNDNEPNTRHFCIDWDTSLPDPTDPECLVAGHYDADDYARDMADFAGLIEVVPDGKQGNFIAMFSIAFGAEARDEPTAAPLLRYIADAGDNGFIDNNLQEDWRDNHQLDFGDYTRYGDPDICESSPALHSTIQCGQYYYAADLQSLTQVFEDIASRMFTRLAR